MLIMTTRPAKTNSKIMYSATPVAKTDTVGYRRRIRGMTEMERVLHFRTVVMVDKKVPDYKQKGFKSKSLNKCLKLLEVRSMDRGGDCSFRNSEIAKVLNISTRSVTRHIAELEKQGFISVLYQDVVKMQPIPARDPEAVDLDDDRSILKNADGKPVLSNFVKRSRLTYRIIRCHRIIIKNRFKAPMAKVPAQSKAFKPFKFDFRPKGHDGSYLNLNNIDLQVIQKAREPELIANYNMEAFRSNEKRKEALQNLCNKNIPLGQALNMVTEYKPIVYGDNSIKPRSLEEFINHYAASEEKNISLDEAFGAPNSLAEPTTEDLYHEYKLKAELNQDDGLSVLGKQFFIDHDRELCGTMDKASNGIDNRARRLGLPSDLYTI